jgi:hypothetical protein
VEFEGGAKLIQDCQSLVHSLEEVDRCIGGLEAESAELLQQCRIGEGVHTDVNVVNCGIIAYIIEGSSTNVLDDSIRSLEEDEIPVLRFEVEQVIINGLLSLGDFFEGRNSCKILASPVVERLETEIFHAVEEVSDISVDLVDKVVVALCYVVVSEG